MEPDHSNEQRENIESGIVQQIRKIKNREIKVAEEKNAGWNRRCGDIERLLGGAKLS